MDLSLVSAIRKCFDGYGNNYTSLSGINVGALNPQSAYMTVPATGDLLDIPVFAIDSFMDKVLIRNEPADVLAVSLQDSKKVSTFKSMDVAVHNLLAFRLSDIGLVRLPHKNDADPVYYCTHGAILDHNYNPLLLMSWRLKIEEELRIRYNPQEAVLRVSPLVFTDRATSVERFIINRIIPTALSISRIYPPNELLSSVNNTYNPKIKVEIAYCPFSITHTDAPSISTTNEELLSVALDNLDELVQQ